jgi:hypothetical protein
MQRMRRTIVATIAALALTLTASGTAYAQATLDGYVDEGPRIQDRFPGEPEEPVTEERAVTPSGSGEESGSGSDLPFTGLDLGLIAAAGGLLLALGFGMRRVVRAPESA